MVALRKESSVDGGWTSERVECIPTEYYRLLVEDIARADKSIELVSYIFRYDEVGRAVVDALAAAAKRGVKIRVIVDGVGSDVDAGKIAAFLSYAGVAVRIYHPLPWVWTHYRWSMFSGGIFTKLFHFLIRLNNRDHRKLCIVDRRWAWCGSFNLCADHLGLKVPWRDYAAQVSGQGVADLVASFDGDWLKQEQKKRKLSLRYVRVNNSLQLRRVRNQLMLKRIRQAKRRVWISSAYFAPSAGVLRSIKEARSRGVDVKVTVAGRSDIFFFPILSATYYADLISWGVEVYAYQRGILHAKVLLVDEHCILGSSNLNHRSFYHDLESDVVLTSPATIAAMEGYLEQDMADSKRETLAEHGRFYTTFIFGYLLRVVRYWV